MSETTEEKNTVLLPRKLTAENGAKDLLRLEFFETVSIKNELYCTCGDCEKCWEYPDEPELIEQKVAVSWTTIKAIYDKIVENLEIVTIKNK